MSLYRVFAVLTIGCFVGVMHCISEVTLLLPPSGTFHCHTNRMAQGMATVWLLSKNSTWGRAIAGNLSATNEKMLLVNVLLGMFVTEAKLTDTTDIFKMRH